ncbi:MAG: hypothetical protein LBS23_02565 [Holosporaceae bacterium]|nr:hypothetical protein [Holosporaceae bacterium]
MIAFGTGLFLGRSRDDYLDISKQRLKEYQTETGKSDEETAEILEVILELSHAFSDYKITKRTFALIDKLITISQIPKKTPIEEKSGENSDMTPKRDVFDDFFIEAEKKLRRYSNERTV